MIASPASVGVRSMVLQEPVEDEGLVENRTVRLSPPKAARHEIHHSRTVQERDARVVLREHVLQSAVQHPEMVRDPAVPNCRPSKLLPQGHKPLGLQARLRFDEVVRKRSRGPGLAAAVVYGSCGINDERETLHVVTRSVMY